MISPLFGFPLYFAGSFFFLFFFFLGIYFVFFLSDFLCWGVEWSVMVSTTHAVTKCRNKRCGVYKENPIPLKTHRQIHDE